MPRGRRPLPWIKLWHDMLGDAKIAQLSAAEKWCWVGILLLAGQSPVRGYLMLTETKPMSEKDIAKALLLSPKEKKGCFLMIQKMTEMGSLRRNSNECLEVIHFKERQGRYASDFIDYHRESSPDKLLKPSELTPAKVLKEGEGRGETKDTPLSNDKGARKGLRADPRVTEIFKEMESFLGYPEKVEKNPIPNYPKEGQFIKKMLGRHFTREEILSCWKAKVQQRRGEFVSMAWANDDIANLVRVGEHLPAVKPEENNAVKPEKLGGRYGTTYRPPKPEGASKPGRTIDAEGEAGTAD